MMTNSAAKNRNPFKLGKKNLPVTIYSDEYREREDYKVDSQQSSVDRKCRIVLRLKSYKQEYRYLFKETNSSSFALCFRYEVSLIH